MDTKTTQELKQMLREGIRDTMVNRAVMIDTATVAKFNDENLYHSKTKYTPSYKLGLAVWTYLAFPMMAIMYHDLTTFMFMSTVVSFAINFASYYSSVIKTAPDAPDTESQTSGVFETAPDESGMEIQTLDEVVHTRSA